MARTPPVARGAVRSPTLLLLGVAPLAGIGLGLVVPGARWVVAACAATLALVAGVSSLWSP